MPASLGLWVGLSATTGRRAERSRNVFAGGSWVVVGRWSGGCWGFSAVFSEDSNQSPLHLFAPCTLDHAFPALERLERAPDGEDIRRRRHAAGDIRPDIPTGPLQEIALGQAVFGARGVAWRHREFALQVMVVGGADFIE